MRKIHKQICTSNGISPISAGQNGDPKWADK